ncbi:PAS domain-containing sensor histidine kinase [Variovorax sp. PCZ-1]|uniref:PAS domain-containing sensor histidine kinase n=1 Tax=Variovorax sp. PCZ-1 TaxID=2835533 RepID=UPI0020C0961E|nr:PAS domain-containing sensor histidine kinase [Variovorax sp. PCZ-1]
MSASAKPARAVSKQPTWLVRWWRSQSPTRQNRFALIAPLAAVAVFLMAIVASFGYLRLEEMSREQEAVQRDVEYAQQRLRLRLLERQEQLMRLAADINNKQIDTEDFVTQAESLVRQYPELQSVVWIDAKKRIRVSYTSPSMPGLYVRLSGDMLRHQETDTVYNLVRDVRQPMYSVPFSVPTGIGTQTMSVLQVQVPLADGARFGGVVMGEYQVDGLMRYGVPAEITAKYAVALLDDKNRLLSGNTSPKRNAAVRLLPWVQQDTEYEVPVSPLGNSLVLRAEAYRASLGVIGSALFWLVLVLSLMTAWLLVTAWRHTRRRIQTQAALLQETSFRRAMENSMLTGMRALDLQGRITYVNPAFCQMTGWSEAQLVGLTAPFPYWPEDDREMLAARLEEEISGRTTPGGFQVRVKHRDGSIFDARMYVSPLVDGKGVQSGWMTSMTDITEPNRVRKQLSESYERFTTVLEGLDASVSVAPLGGDELLFANKMYRLWFGSKSKEHLSLVEQAGRMDSGIVQPDFKDSTSGDSVDSLAGLPTEEITAARSENAEIFIPDLNKWLEVRSRYLNWTDGRLAQMVIATDITPRRMAEDLAAQQAEKAQSASRLITMGEMASSVAHELNQPLTAISNYCTGMVSRIQGGQINQEEMLAALEKTARQAQRAGQIIHRIRSFVKRSAPNRTESDVSQLVSEALELAEIELRRRNVRLTHYLAARLPRLMVDPILIEQVLVNLLKNAAESIDNANRPSNRRSVELRAIPKQIDGVGEAVEFTVTDTGQGLAPEVMQRLFEAFFSTKAEGMGIGLNLCRSIVESHQGRMHAENLYNGDQVTGCRFSFWLPCQPVAYYGSRTGSFSAVQA